MKKILYFSEYLANKYGKQLYRIPVNLPFGCPHRKRNSGKGCIFCAEDGARARHLKKHFNLKEQIDSGINYVKRRYGSENPYIAYFQSFTNTYADIESIRRYYSEALSMADFSMIITATRPDCLGNDVINYLSELNGKYELWVELGVQTANDETLKTINRQHDFACVEDAVKKLAGAGIKTAAHLILGLPGEDSGDFRRTAEKLSALPFSGVKVHNLLVLKNTPLAKLYAEGSFKAMNEYEYAAALLEFLRALPDGWTVMRINADADEKEIIAPKWWMKKGQFLDYFNELFSANAKCGDFTDFSHIPGVMTDDGTRTLYHPRYRQHFHTLAGAATEALRKFILPSEIISEMEKGADVKILDIGFGLGYNAISAAKEAVKIEKGHAVIVSLEHDRKTLEAALKLYAPDSLDALILECLLREQKWENKYAEIKIIFDDARQTIQKLNQSFDCIFLDAFSPDTNPELWTYDFFRIMKKRLSGHGRILTYSSAYPVLGALKRCGFHIGETEAFGRRKGGTIAALDAYLIQKPLSGKELNIICKSTAGAAYRDPSLDWTHEKILAFRSKVISELRKHNVPKWFRD
ncbi:MAG: TIGR01212 family radical SAM protein [Lentisphaerae bacterium GWF2_44_16]|nr:MAG: TIGR01212 family radical SAM protein [Lentisphaerae bacterium GWF2_44_16]